MGKTHDYRLVDKNGEYLRDAVCRKIFRTRNYPDARKEQKAVFERTGEWFDIYMDGEKI